MLINDTFVNPFNRCNGLYVIGGYCVLLLIGSVFLNGILLWAILKNKSLQTPINMLIAALSFVNLFGSLVELPIVGAAAFYCSFIFGLQICYLEAFIMYFTGCTSILLLVAISLERFFVIVKPFKAHLVTNKACAIAIAICSLISLFWCCMPLVGWSYYSLEGAGISCSVEWHARTMNVLSYNICIFIFIYLLPLVTLVGTNIKIIKMIRKSAKRFENSTDIAAKKQFKKERHLVILTIILITAFFISWTPYAGVSLYVVFNENANVDPLIATIPAFFAKATLVWPALLTLLSNKEIKAASPLFRSIRKIVPMTMNASAATHGSLAGNNISTRH